MPRSILLLHRDEDRRSLLAYLLGNWGYDVTDTAEPRSAARMLLQNPEPLIAILHRGVEGQPAISDLCRDTRNSPHDGNKYLIIVEEELSDSCLEQDFEAGADDVIAEPMRPAELRLRLGRACRALQRCEECGEGSAE